MKSVLLFAFGLCLTASAEPVTLSRLQAFELHETLSGLPNGLAPANVVSAADDINALDPVVAAYRREAIAIERAKLGATTPERVAELMKLADKFDAKGEEKVTFDLTIITLAQSEIDAAKLTTAQLARIKRLLKPDAKPEKKTP